MFIFTLIELFLKKFLVTLKNIFNYENYILWFIIKLKNIKVAFITNLKYLLYYVF